MTISLNGIIEKITYKNNDNGFIVLKAKIQNKITTVTGKCFIPLGIGQPIIITGKWENTKYGTQFSAESIQASVPETVLGIERYLASGIIKGIGVSTARKIVKSFGIDTLIILNSDEALEHLQQVEGIGLSKAEKIIDSWRINEKMKNIMIFFQGYHLSQNLIMKIYQTYGDKSIQIVKEQPYKLAQEVKGIGFISADTIAMSFGIQKDDSNRIESGLHHVLIQASNSGSSGLPFNQMLQKTEELLQISYTLVKQTLYQLLNNKQLIALKNDYTIIDVIEDEQMIYDNPLIINKMNFYTEKGIVVKLFNIMSDQNILFKNTNITDEIEYLKNQYRINLSPEQEDAINTLINKKILIVTGGPGTGKTTLINAIIKVAKHIKQDLKLKLVAPTGRAAKRISETSGAFASTIHRLLEFNPEDKKFKYNEINHLKCDLMILDEASMIDIYMMNAFLKALPNAMTLIIVGDVDQLPSIGPGQVLYDLIESNLISTIKLNKIFRQASTSRIVTNAHLINQNKLPNFDKAKDFEFIDVIDEDTLKHHIKLSMQEYIGAQILTPMQKGFAGVRILNPFIQQIINPMSSCENDGIDSYGYKYFVGDKIIQLENNYNKNVFNGDIGTIIKIDREEQEIFIDFGNQIVLYEFNEMEQISLAYAITVHKSQGSEYDTVILPILTQHFIMLNKNLLYTAITRAKKHLIILGQKKAIAMAVKNINAEKRYSALNGLLISLHN